MMFCWRRFNIYFLLALTLIAGPSCRSTKPTESTKNKPLRQLTRLSIYLETRADASNRHQVASIFREHPIPITVEKSPFLNEHYIAEASIVETVGGFTIQLQFD